MEIRLRPPKMEFFKIFSFLWKGLQISLLTSPQPPQTLSLSQVMQEKFDIGLLCPNMEIRLRAPKNGIFQNFFIFDERSPDFASNEFSTIPTIKFKLSYARKRDFGLLCPNMEIQPQAPKNGTIKIFSFF